jgi:hypothetical protein
MTIVQRLKNMFTKNPTPPIAEFREIVEAAREPVNVSACREWSAAELLAWNRGGWQNHPSAQLRASAAGGGPGDALESAGPNKPAEQPKNIDEKIQGIFGAAFASELGRRPVYILLQSQVDLAAAEGCLAITAADLDLALRKDIAGDWLGRAPCLVLNDSELIEAFGDDPDRLESEIYKAIVHEAAHVACFGVPTDGEMNVDRAFATLEATFEEFPSPTPEVTVYQEHDSQFFRALIHVHCRAAVAGITVHLHGTFADFDLSDVYDYMLALQPELVACEFMPLTDVIRDVAPPEEFVALFAYDTNTEPWREHVGV